MTKSIQELYREWENEAFPALGKDIGDFPLYDSFLSGIASRAAGGEAFAPADIPQPDAGSVEAVGRLRAKNKRTTDEEAFLRYFSLLEQIRDAIPRR